MVDSDRYFEYLGRTFEVVSISQRPHLGELEITACAVCIDIKKSSPIKKVIFHSPATIVYWKDGSKTVVKCDEELFDREKGLAMAISKKMLGNKGNYFNEFKKWIK